VDSESTIIVRVATANDLGYAEEIANEMASSAKARGTGIAFRTPEYLQQKMLEGKAVIALSKDGTWAGYCYIEAWSHGKFVANSGLIVSPKFRGHNVATRIKTEIFNLSRRLYADAKIFGLTTGLAVMKINSDLGYEPVTYSELTDDEQFWSGCKSCVNFNILTSKERKNCLCTAMLFDPNRVVKNNTSPHVVQEAPIKKKRKAFKTHFSLYERWLRFKKHVLLKKKDKHIFN
jgi:hypothetical protein